MQKKIQVKMQKCECGTWTNEPCEETITPEDWVIVEYVPVKDRWPTPSDHTWPKPHSIKVYVTEACANTLFWDENLQDTAPYAWARVIED